MIRKDTLLTALLCASLYVPASVASQQWSYTYNDLGLVETVDGPRTDINDVTRYEYTERGWLTKIINAAGHEVTFGGHNIYGKPTVITDANGFQYFNEYDTRGRLIKRSYTANGANVEYGIAYRPSGEVEKITAPDGSWVAFEYDAARRLIALQNQAGERIEYTLDLMGNVTAQSTKDSNGNVTYQSTYNYNEIGQMLSAIGADSGTDKLWHDANGNLKNHTDPNQNFTQYEYDALERLTKVIDADQNTTQYEYDQADNLTKVVDPRGVTTTYQYDYLGRVTERNSPSTGITTYQYDDADNLIATTDAKNITTRYSYDALNRLLTTSIDGYPSYSETYHYDTYPSGDVTQPAVGQLTEVEDQSGRILYTYNERGQLEERLRSMDVEGKTRYLGFNYLYNNKDQLSSVIYPEGLKVNYQWSQGQLTGIDIEGLKLGQRTVLSDITYQPFGGVSGFTWGNGITLSRNYDLNGRLISHDISPVDTIEYYYDLASNLLTQNRNDGQFTYEYDNLHRLTEEEADNYAKRYTYDAVGNRTGRVQESFKADGTTQTSTQKLTYETDSNKLKKRWSTAITHDENGNIISGISSHVFTYGPNNRMMSAKIGTAERARFYYNAYGERIRKLSSKSGTHVLFQYGSNGKLLTESFVNKKGHYYRINNYIWYGDTPVALVEQNLSSTGNVWAEYIKYIHTDHLNTPIYITQNDQTVIWKWVSDAFGQGSQITDPDGNGKRFYFRLRFPGQFYDWETGLNYNYFRDYAPAYGRYVQSDPIGLNGGLNTFGYVGGNPVGYVDPTGESGVMAVPRPLLIPRPSTTPKPFPEIQPTLAPPWGPRDPFGNHCKRLGERISNSRDEIYNKRFPDLESNPSKLPYRIGPGELLKDTVRGHEKLLNRRLNELKKLEDRYARECSPLAYCQ
jgi:RHS repeat-associated protein